jgi:hypothetical protein
VKRARHRAAYRNRFVWPPFSSFRELRSAISVERRNKLSKAPPSRSGKVLRGQLQEPNQKRKPPMKVKSSRFERLVARYYPSVYGFASRLTDDPLGAAHGYEAENN